MKKLWLLVVVFMLPALACGHLVPTPTPAPTPTLAPTPSPTMPAHPLWTPSPTPPPPPPTATPTPLPSLEIGKTARVVVSQILNVREKPGVHSHRIGRLPPRAKVKILQGPVEKDGYRWWQIDDGYGLVGWVVEGDREGKWLIPASVPMPTPQPKTIRVGHWAVVDTRGAEWLTMRTRPSTDATIMAKHPPGDRLKILDGPIMREGYIWWKVEDNRHRVGWVTSGDGIDRWMYGEK